ncbi:MAG: RNA polymerase factor sigma-54 [Treponema sp.]|jgi:RNA polymerase sigma-54 factor|nr:RNA polymerase factor sigma-54 [Treponema sp.]
MQASFVQKQQLGFKMNPQAFQSLKLMELPIVDLREKIEEELERNPALEVLKDPSTVTLDESEPPRKELEEYFEASSDSGFAYVSAAAAAASDAHHQFVEGVLNRPETLQQHLLWQLQLEPVDDELRAIAAILIQNLDDDGFHKEPPEALFEKSLFDGLPPPGMGEPRLGEAMRLVQMLDPLGCCTADFRESLRVQVALLRDAPACMECSLEHLELFERGKFSEAARKMDCGEDEARACFNFIKKLSPYPGRRFTATEIRFVIPDIRVARKSGASTEGGFEIIINDEVIPVLGIDPFFERFSPKPRDRDTDAANRPAREFARENVREARQFIGSIAMRNHTIKNVAKKIVQRQRAFFDNGPQYLVPLTLGDIAEELGVHEATVSRAANDKYMQTEWGIFEMRYFFTNAISGTGSSGSRFSKEAVKAIIRELIGTEKRRLSDIEITELLERRGISLARRTVAKYRKELDLGSSYNR